MKYLKATLLGSGALASLLLSSFLTSCQDEDYGYTTQQIRDSVYARNFEKMYGEIAEDQTWDFSSYYYYNQAISEGSTRAIGSGVKQTYDTWVDVNPAVTEWLNENMAEKQDHSAEVAQFEMDSNKEFYIMPIYQGQSGMMWDLYIAEEGNDTEVKIWDKSENLRYKTDYMMWEEFFYKESDSWSNGNKYQLLKFASPFSDFSNRQESWIGKDFAKILFQVPTVEGQDAENTYLKGGFFFTYDGVYTAITESNFPDFFSNQDNQAHIESAQYGKFSFCASDNVTISNGSLSASGNQVNLNPLLNKTYSYEVDVKRKDSNGDDVLDSNGNPIYDKETRYKTITDFSKLEFIMSDDSWVDRDHSFYTWSGDRVRVFVKYSYTATDYTNLVTTNDNNNTAYFNAHTISKNHIQTKLMKINSAAIDGKFRFNLKTKSVTKGDTDAELAEVGDDHYSDEGTMNIIRYFSGSNSPLSGANKTDLRTKLNSIITSAGGTALKDDFDFWIVGCEDASGPNCDHDYNDVVFLIVANELPKLSIKSIIEKRYMIEDLGSTYDFDFNDIVVDVTEEVTSLQDDNHYCIKQTAKIVNLCGTIPFQIKIGDVTIGDDNKFMNGRRTNESWYAPLVSETEYVKVLQDAHVEGDYKNARVWDPATNNIKVYVYPNISTDGATSVYYSTNLGTSGSNDNQDAGNVQTVQLVEFPKVGKFPYIIATDLTVGWMGENVSIPVSWLKTKPQGYQEWLDNGGSNGSQAYNPQGNRYEMWDLYNGDPVQTPTGNSWGGNLGIEKEVFNNASEGDVITIHSKDFSANSALGFKQKDNGYNPIPGIGDSGNFYNVNGDISVTITQGILSSLQSYGLVFNGHDITFVKVTLTHKKSSGTGSN